MTAKTISKLTLEQYQALVTGIPKYCPNATFTVASQNFTATEAVAFITTVLNAVSAVSTAKSGVTDARLAEEKILTEDGATVKGIRDVIATMFSNNTTTLEAFDITPPKVRQPLSVEARAAATAKAKATRKARGTESKKQKALISGDVTGVTITPIVSTTTTSTASSPTTTGSTSSTSSPSVTPVTTGVAATTPSTSSSAVPATGSGAAHS